MHPHTGKITSKGQITIPKEIRDFLNSEMVTFEISDNQVLIKPVVKVRGSLKQYSKNIAFDKAREAAWDGVASDYQP